MRIQVAGAFTRPQLILNLRPSWLLILTSSSSMVACFSYAMGTTGSRHGQAALRGCIVMTGSGITLWIASA
jgi:hypothetical protein